MTEGLKTKKKSGLVLVVDSKSIPRHFQLALMTTPVAAYAK